MLILRVESLSRIGVHLFIYYYSKQHSMQFRLFACAQIFELEIHVFLYGTAPCEIKDVGCIVEQKFCEQKRLITVLLFFSFYSFLGVVP